MILKKYFDLFCSRFYHSSGFFIKSLIYRFVLALLRVIKTTLIAMSFFFLLITSSFANSKASDNDANSDDTYNIDKKIITIAVDYRCPYNCDDKGDHPGFLIELIKRSLYIYGFDVRYKLMPWHSALDDAIKGKVDGVIGVIEDHENRFIKTTIPLETISLKAFTRNDNSWIFDGVDSLKSKKLGIIMDYKFNDQLNAYISMNFPSNPERFMVEEGEVALVECLASLIDADSDVYIDDERVVNYYLRNNKLDSYVREAGVVSKDRIPIHLYLNSKFPKNKLFIKSIDEGIESLKATGEYDDLRRKYKMDD